MPDPRIRRIHTRASRHAPPPVEAALPEPELEPEAVPEAEPEAVPEPEPEAVPEPEPEAVPQPEPQPEAAVDDHLAAADAESAEAEAVALAAVDVADDGSVGTPEAEAAAPEGADEGSAPADAVGWFRETPLEESPGEEAEEAPSEAAEPAAAVPAEEEAAAEEEHAPEEPVDVDDVVARVRDRPIVYPFAEPASPPRRSRARSILLGFLTIVAVAIVGFVAGLMLPVVFPGPGIGTASPSPGATASAAPTTAPSSGAPTATPAAPATVPASVAPTVSATTRPTPTVYVVKAGDNLARIARRFGVTVEAIQVANSIANPNLIHVGQKLVIPPPVASPAPSPTP